MDSTNSISNFFRHIDSSGMTLKELVFTKVYLETLGNATEAAWQAYNCSSRDSAKALGWKVKRRLFNKG